MRNPLSFLSTMFRRADAVAGGIVQSIHEGIKYMSDTMTTLTAEVSGLRDAVTSLSERLQSHLRVFADQESAHAKIEAELKAQITALQAVPANTAANEAKLQELVGVVQSVRSQVASMDLSPPAAPSPPASGSSQAPPGSQTPAGASAQPIAAPAGGIGTPVSAAPTLTPDAKPAA